MNRRHVYMLGLVAREIHIDRFDGANLYDNDSGRLMG